MSEITLPKDAEGREIPLDTSNWSVGSMTLMRRYDGEPIVRVELDTSVMLDVSVNGSCSDTVSADVTADAYIEDIKYCPFCGEEL